MPNHITNKFIELSSDELFEKYTLNKEGNVDFSILKSMPEELNITCKGTFDGNLRRLLNLSMNFQTALAEGDISKAIEVGIKEVGKYKNTYGWETTAEKDDIMFYINERNLGYGDWYQWSLDHWGTKWNAYDQCPPHEYQTAWSTPYEWLKELGTKLDFVQTYADEDTGSNYGFVIAVNGTVQKIDCSKLIDDRYTNIALALHVRDSEADYYQEYLEECYSEELTQEEINELAEKQPEMIKKFYSIIDEYKEMYLAGKTDTLHETDLFSRMGD